MLIISNYIFFLENPANSVKIPQVFRELMRQHYTNAYWGVSGDWHAKEHEELTTFLATSLELF